MIIIVIKEFAIRNFWSVSICWQRLVDAKVLIDSI
jgi:hypothetical protein